MYDINTNFTAVTVSELLRENNKRIKLLPTQIRLNEKIATLATKASLKAEQDKIKELQEFDSSYFHDKRHFENDRTQIYLAFMPVLRYFKKLASNDHTSAWKPTKGLNYEVLNLLLQLIIVLIKY